MLVLVEPTLKYHPDLFEVLTLACYPGWGQCMVGSLTWAVSSQSVTEELQGGLTLDSPAVERKGICPLDCQADMLRRNGAVVPHPPLDLVIRGLRVEESSLNGQKVRRG